MIFAKNFCKEFCKKLWKNNTWNIRCLDDESFVPGNQQTSVLYCRLSDFKSSGKKSQYRLEIIWISKMQLQLFYLLFKIDFAIAFWNWLWNCILKIEKGKMQVQQNVFGCKFYNLVRAFKVMLFLRYKMDTYCIL